jgi:hypothetical protein
MRAAGSLGAPTDEAADAGRAGSALSRAGPPGHRHQAPEPVHAGIMAEVLE